MQKNQEKKKYAAWLKAGKILLFAGLGFFFVWISIRGISADNWHAMKDSVKQVNTFWGWTFLGLSFLASVASHYVRSERNILLIEPLNYRVRHSMSFYAVMVCYLGNMVFPRLGEVLRCTFLQRYEKVPFQKALGTVLAERSLDTFMWLIFLVIAILLNTSALSNITVNEEGTTIGALLSAKTTGLITNYKLYFIVAIGIAFIVAAYLTRSWWGKIPFFAKIRDFFAGIWQGLISIKDVRKPIRFWVLTAILWILYFFGVYTVFIAFGFMNQLPYFSILPTFSVLVFGTIGFMIAPEGLGAYPLIVAGTMVLYHVDYVVGLAAGWVGWIVQTLVILLFGGVSMLLATLSNRPEKLDNNSENG
ncbi:MAG: flippase-like domain-containing protein [Bacteroidales bacterium]|jgi:uncharacterized protein (TIRG00374 family)|nr:flippase-like domain-containing protein [Bacteroidales bacterium]